MPHDELGSIAKIDYLRLSWLLALVERKHQSARFF